MGDTDREAINLEVKRMMLTTNGFGILPTMNAIRSERRFVLHSNLVHLQMLTAWRGQWRVELNQHGMVTT